MPSLKGLAAFAVLLAAAVAAPLDTTVTTSNGVAPAVLFQSNFPSSNDECGASTFINNSSPASPTVSDCLRIASNIALGGTWQVSVANLHKIVQYGTCAFGVTAVVGENVLFHVGNQDIIDLIHSSIDMFQWDGLVGAQGQMWCNPKMSEKVQWEIYHN
jgi:hypothetical protein